MEESETEFKISQRQQLPKDESEIRSAKNEQGQSEAQNDFDPEQYMLGEATFWQQLKATIIRNLIRKRRGLRQTLNELITPTYYLALVILMKFVIPNPTYPAVDTPLGYSTLADSISVIHSKSFGVVPNKQIYKDFIEDTIGNYTKNLTFFENEESLTLDDKLNFGIVFNDSCDFETKLCYKIRLDGSYLPSATEKSNDGLGCRYTEKVFPNPNDNNTIKICNPTQYLFTGFLGLQYLLDHHWIKEKKSDLKMPEEIRFELPPRNITVGDTSSIVLRAIIPIYMVISLGTFVGPMLFVVVEEKEKKIKESMKMVGLRGSVFWLSWLAVYSVSVFIVTIIASCILSFVVLDKIGNFGIVFILTFLFGISMIMFAFILTSFFTKAKTAAGLGGFSAILLACFYYLKVFMDNVPNSVYWVLSLLSPPAFAIAMEELMSSDLDNRDLDLWDDSNGFPIAGSLIMLFLDIILYGLLAAYLDNVIPTEYGTRKSPFYFLQPSFWKNSKIEDKTKDIYGKNRVSRATSAQISERDYIGPDIEVVPDKLRDTEALVIQNLKKTFKKWNEEPLHAVAGINLKIYPGEITCILGHNGAGKTTLFNMLTGMTAPTSGTANICGYDIRDPNQMEKIRKMTGICPQHDILFDELTVGEHLAFFARIRGMKENQVSSAVSGILNDIDLMEKRDTLSKQLSGGQKRKLSVGIALIGDPKIIFLDEPTAGVDPYSRRHMWSLLRQKKEGKVILLTTHFMDEADILADRKAIISKGSLRCYGTSLFLKNRFGLGYHLTMVLKHSADLDGITQLIENHIPKAKRARLFGRELNFILPRDEVQMFAPLFKDIETEIQDEGHLGIDSYGTSMPTLEEVFLRLGDEEKQNDSVGTAATAAEKDFVVDDQKLVQQPTIYGAISDQETLSKTNGKNLEGYGFEPVTTQKSWFQTYKALLKIRFVTKYREPGAVIMYFVIPILYTVFSLYLTSIQSSKTAADTALVIDLGMYNGSYEHPYFFQNFVTNNDSDLNIVERISGIQEIINESTFMDLIRYYGEKISPLAIYNVNQSVDDGFVASMIIDDRKSHSMPVAINDLTNAMAKYYLGEEYEIQVISQPFEAQSLNANFDGGAFAGSMFLGFVFVVVVMGQALELIGDRENRAKNQLRVNGLNFTLYYASFYTVLGGLIFLLCGALIVIAFAFQLELVTFGPSLVIFVTLYLIFPIPGTLFASTLSYLFDTIDGGQMLMGLSSMMGFIPYIIVYLLQSLQVGDNQIPAKIAHVIFLILSPAYIPFGIITQLNYLNMVCSYQGDCEKKTSTDFFAEFEIYTIYIACFVHTIVWGIGLKIADIKKEGGNIFTSSDSMEKRIGKSKNTIVPIEAGENDDDADVIAESVNVDQYFEQDQNDVNVVAVRKLQKIYKKKKKKQTKVAVKNVSFGIPKGQVFGLLGPNGAGKTTTMRMIIAEENPTQGKIRIGKHNIESNTSPGFDQLGYCPQFDAVWKRITVREHLETYAAIRGVPTNQISSLTQQIMEGLRIEEHADKYTHDCSGGTKRKLSYGMAMLGDPKVVLLDEPSSGMDPHSKRFVWDTILASFKGDRGAILTTHSMEEAEALCTRVGIMVKGELKCLGSTQHLKNKYGSGYVLVVKCVLEEEDWKNVEDDIFEIFDENKTNLDESFADRRIYSVLQDAVKSLGDVFAALEKLKHDHNIEEYSFSQTTLEQVFIRFAKDQEIEDEEVSSKL